MVVVAKPMIQKIVLCANFFLIVFVLGHHACPPVQGILQVLNQKWVPYVGNTLTTYSRYSVSFEPVSSSGNQATGDWGQTRGALWVVLFPAGRECGIWVSTRERELVDVLQACPEHFIHQARPFPYTGEYFQACAHNQCVDTVGALRCNTILGLSPRNDHWSWTYVAQLPQRFDDSSSVCCCVSVVSVLLSVWRNFWVTSSVFVSFWTKKEKHREGFADGFGKLSCDWEGNTATYSDKFSFSL